MGTAPDAFFDRAAAVELTGTEANTAPDALFDSCGCGADRNSGQHSA